MNASSDWDTDNNATIKEMSELYEYLEIIQF